MLYAFGLKLGAKLLVRGKPRLALRLLIKPVNYWRTVEYRLICDAARFQPGDRVLDIGSPKLLSIYLAEVVGADVFATDIHDYFLAPVRTMADIEGIPRERLHLGVEDGRSLSFGENSFDKVYALSVLEHIPDQGDARCMTEIHRVLVPGGRCYLTVPFWPESRVETADGRDLYWTRHSVAADTGQVFYQRRYSERDLFDRLIGPSGMELTEVKYVGETVLTGSDRELTDFLPWITGPIQPVLSKLFHTPPVDSWEQLAKPLCALLVLQK